MFKYKIGDLVKISQKADGYEHFYDEFEVEVDELGLVIECIEKNDSYRQWYRISFNKSRKELDFEEWELEAL